MNAILALIFCLTASAVDIEEHSLVYESYKFEKDGKVPAAIGRMKKVASSESDSYFVHMRLGHLYVVSKESSKAIPFYVKATELKPKSIEPWLALAAIAEETTDEVKLKRYLSEALKRDPYNHETGKRYVAVAKSTKSNADGLDHVQDLLSVWPNDINFLEHRAFFLAALGKKAEARLVVSEILLLDPDNEYARTSISKE